ncbi:phosphomethylpyrimidine synthase ThiC [bacterium]|nr:phosphomethylpyrimidine synthase ThiC [bacterium]
MSTQIEKALNGEITSQMAFIANAEHVDPDSIRQRVASGRIAIPRNINRTFDPIGIGEGLTTKVNANLGTSPLLHNGEFEIEKLKIAIKHGTHTVMDLSTGGNLFMIRKRMLQEAQLPLGTVPIYELIKLVRDKKKTDHSWTKDDFFEVIERQAQEGVDFMTLHAGVTRAAVQVLRESNRLTSIVSRGGSLIAAWIAHNGDENPLYEYYDELLDILYRYDVTISLGDGLRPGSLNDASDAAQISELVVLGELTERAWAKKVQVIVEGPGHIPLNEVVMNVEMQKKICHGAPFYVLGPLVTDVAPGYDELVGAIGGAIAAAAGTDYLCYVTPAEHLALPNLDDVRRGVIASRIAAHAADIAKGIPNAIDWDNEMSRARADLDWEKQIKLAVDPDRAKEKRDELPTDSTDESGACTMCGEFCAFITTQDAGLKKTPKKIK